MGEFNEMNNIFDDSTNHLFELILTLGTVQECEKFFLDVCTVKEIKEIAQRCEVAKLLLDGKVYIDIVKTTGASTATISRVNRALHYGEGGYKLAVDRVAEKKD